MRCRPLCVARGQLLQRCPPWRWACASRATNVIWQRLDGQGYAPQKHDVHQYDSYYVNLLSRPCPSIANTERCAYGYWLRSCSPCWWLGHLLPYDTTPWNWCARATAALPSGVAAEVTKDISTAEAMGMDCPLCLPSSVPPPHLTPLFLPCQRPLHLAIWRRAAASTASPPPTTRACPLFH